MNEMTNDKSLSSEDLGKGNKKVIKNELPATELRTEDFFYELPEELIAQHPMEKRDASRLMVLNRADNTIEHRHFYDITDYLHPGDVMVINDSKVIPARLYGYVEGRPENVRVSVQGLYSVMVCSRVRSRI